MIYVGIDVAKTTHYAAVADSDGVVFVEPFAFDNDAPGFAKFISKIASFPKEQLIIGLETVFFTRRDSRLTLRFFNDDFR